MRPRVVSLFSGGGGGDVGLGRAGLAVVAHCEIERHARAVLREHYPDVPLHGDVQRLVGAARLMATPFWCGQCEERRMLQSCLICGADLTGSLCELMPSGADLVVGGSPCQDLSVAGKRAGLDGARSGLFYEQIRVWEESGALNLLWENVLGALSSNKGRDFALVLGAIVGAPVPVPAGGWGSAGVVAGPTGVAAWRVLDLQHFGPPQRRRRVFVCGARDGGVDPAEVLLEPESVRGDSAPRRRAREAAAGGAGSGAAGACCGYQLDSCNTHGCAARPRAVAGTLNASAARTRGAGVFPEHIVAFDWQNSPSQGMAVRSESSDSLRTNAVPAVLAFDYKQDGSNSGADVSPTLLATPHDQSHANGGGQLAVCVTGERTHALTSEGADASEDGTGRGTPIVARYVRSDHYEAASVGSTLAARDSRGPQDLVTAGIPRRLTPRECERLMGWEDDWTRYGVDEDGRRYELSDSARYRICGNGIGAPHTHWIGLRFLAAWQRLSTIHQERAA